MVALFIFRIKTRDQIADDGIALTSGIFETFAVDHVYATAAVLDDAAALQRACGEGNAGASRTEHFSQEFLCQFESIRSKPVPDHQQPAGKAFFDFMEAMAGSQLAENESLALHELQDAL